MTTLYFDDIKSFINYYNIFLDIAVLTVVDFEWTGGGNTRHVIIQLVVLKVSGGHSVHVGSYGDTGGRNVNRV